MQTRMTRHWVGKGLKGVGDACARIEFVHRLTEALVGEQARRHRKWLPRAQVCVLNLACLCLCLRLCRVATACLQHMCMLSLSNGAHAETHTHEQPRHAVSHCVPEYTCVYT